MTGLDGQIAAVVLDWAGTTIDFGCLAPVAALQSVLLNHGISLSPEEVRVGMGLPKKEHLRGLLGARGAEALADGIYPELEKAIMTQLGLHAELIPGTPELAAWLRDEGVKIGTSTGYTREMMRIVASSAARQGYVPDAVVTPDDVPAGRPAPFMMYANAHRLRAWPLWRFVKIGDTPSDVSEGRNAGSWTVGVARTGNALGHTAAQADALAPRDSAARLEDARHSLEEAGADYVVDSVADCRPVLLEIAGLLRDGARPGITI